MLKDNLVCMPIKIRVQEGILANLDVFPCGTALSGLLQQLPSSFCITSLLVMSNLAKPHLGTLWEFAMHGLVSLLQKVFL